MDNQTGRESSMVYLTDGTIRREQLKTKLELRQYNQCMPFDMENGLKHLDAVGIKHKEKLYFEPPFHCEYGKHIQVGKNFYAHVNCVMLDAAKITIGDNVLFGPNVSLYTAGHPLHHESRYSEHEYGIPITIGSNVCIGGSCVILPGVTIGDNCVICAGSVVTEDIPGGVIAAGNPCRIIRKISEEDKKYNYKQMPFDDEVWSIQWYGQGQIKSNSPEPFQHLFHRLQRNIEKKRQRYTKTL